MMETSHIILQMIHIFYTDDPFDSDTTIEITNHLIQMERNEKGWFSGSQQILHPNSQANLFFMTGAYTHSSIKKVALYHHDEEQSFIENYNNQAIWSMEFYGLFFSRYLGFVWKDCIKNNHTSWGAFLTSILMVVTSQSQIWISLTEAIYLTQTPEWELRTFGVNLAVTYLYMYLYNHTVHHCYKKRSSRHLCLYGRPWVGLFCILKGHISWYLSVYTICFLLLPLWVHKNMKQRHWLLFDLPSILFSLFFLAFTPVC